MVAGDTCASIAGKFGMSCAQVKALNPKSFADDGSAYEGLTLCIGESILFCSMPSQCTV